MLDEQWTIVVAVESFGGVPSLLGIFHEILRAGRLVTNFVKCQARRRAIADLPSVISDLRSGVCYLSFAI
jgi:hypothetical protein